MKFRLPILGAALALGLAVFSMAPAFAATSTSAALTAPVTGSSSDHTVSFVGSFTLTQVVAQQGKLIGYGTISGTATNSVTGQTETLVNQPVTAPLVADQSCTILDLTIGPINLDLLGLVVQTNTIHLTITAQQGPGNLLGNLLCAVTHLLDNTGGPAGALAALLNNIIAILNGL